MKFIAAIVALAALVGATEVPPARVSAAPVQPPGALPISAQLYTVRNAGTLDEQLAMVAAAGIKYVEPFRFAGMKEPPARRPTAPSKCFGTR